MSAGWLARQQRLLDDAREKLHAAEPKTVADLAAALPMAKIVDGTAGLLDVLRTVREQLTLAAGRAEAAAERRAPSGLDPTAYRYGWLLGEISEAVRMLDEALDATNGRR